MIGMKHAKHLLILEIHPLYSKKVTFPKERKKLNQFFQVDRLQTLLIQVYFES